jgi:(p)ppGpp synthase/HD superfamily hydrolase
MDDHLKDRTALRFWFYGRDYQRAARAMAVAERFHRGTRKDGVTPEFSHQVQIALYLRTLEGALLHPEETFAIAMLHDVREDYDLADDEIRSEFGDFVADGVDAMTKVFRGQRREATQVFQRIGDHAGASVAKLADRLHNQSGMLGVFSPAKMTRYMDETEHHFLPMLRRARRNFPAQEPAYENAKLMLTSQLTLLRAVLEAQPAAG